MNDPTLDHSGYVYDHISGAGEWRPWSQRATSGPIGRLAGCDAATRRHHGGSETRRPGRRSCNGRIAWATDAGLAFGVWEERGVDDGRQGEAADAPANT